MNIPFLSKLTALLVIGGFCLSPLGLAGGGVVAAGIILLLAGLNAAERGRAAQEGTAAGQMGALAQGLFSLTVWPFYLCVLGLLVWAMNDREGLSRPMQGARRELAAAPASSPSPAGPKGIARQVNLQPSPAPTGPLPKPRPLMSTLANRAGQPTGNPSTGTPRLAPQSPASPSQQRPGNPSQQSPGTPQRPPARPLNSAPPSRPMVPVRPAGSASAPLPASSSVSPASPAATAVPATAR